MNHGYLAIEDHAAIGNLDTVALVGLDGAIDWCCFPHLDSASVFASILDHRRGGRFRVRAAGVERGEQRYVEDTNVLVTRFTAGEAALVVTDFFAVSGGLHGKTDADPDPAIRRLLRAEGGAVDVEVEWSPRFDYGRRETTISRAGGAFAAHAGGDVLFLTGVAEAEIVEGETGALLRGRFRLEEGERRALVTAWGVQPARATVEHLEDQRGQAIHAWRSWVHEGIHEGMQMPVEDWAGEHAPLVIRSKLAIKLLTNARTGAIAAAATTSLPEEIGGVRNWDYRLAWIRDAALAAQALLALGHSSDARAFVEWAERVAREEGEHSWGLQIAYGLRGQEEWPEEELPGLEGYRRSAPVRIGNGAMKQLQLDIYGELISAAYEILRAGEDLAPDLLGFLPAVADAACRMWREPDYGIWELRNGPFNFVYSKVMVWMALDRALRLARAGIIDGDVERWRAQAEAIRDEVLTRGFDEGAGAFRQSYERGVLDASNVLFPLLEFLPFDDPRVQGTLDRTLQGLTENGLVHRYKADDGVAGGEGAFGLCTFWVVDALAMSGRVDEAAAIFDGIARRANHVGLLAEQVDPRRGILLGNFPQAFSHIGLINSCLYLAHARGWRVPVPAPIGSEAHRHDLEAG